MMLVSVGSIPLCLIYGYLSDWFDEWTHRKLWKAIEKNLIEDIKKHPEHRYLFTNGFKSHHFMNITINTNDSLQ
jgi:hypothetical protein